MRGRRGGSVSGESVADMHESAGANNDTDTESESESENLASEFESPTGLELPEMTGVDTESVETVEHEEL